MTEECHITEAPFRQVFLMDRRGIVKQPMDTGNNRADELQCT